MGLKILNLSSSWIYSEERKELKSSYDSCIFLCEHSFQNILVFRNLKLEMRKRWEETLMSRENNAYLQQSSWMIFYVPRGKS